MNDNDHLTAERFVELYRRFEAEAKHTPMSVPTDEELFDPAWDPQGHLTFYWRAKLHLRNIGHEPTDADLRQFYIDIIDDDAASVLSVQRTVRDIRNA
jgi:hypothetical protein